MRAAIIAMALALAAPKPFAASAITTDPAFGRWVVEGGRAVIELVPCGAGACGELVWLRQPNGPNGEPKVDAENPDPALRRRPICGIRLIEGLEREEPGVWSGGTIYSTRDGRTYSVNLRAAGPETLEVRGFVGIALLGSTRTWSRDDGLRGRCTTLGGAGRER